MKLTYRERLLCRINTYLSYIEVCEERGHPMTLAEAQSCIKPPANITQLAPRMGPEHIKIASSTFSLIAMSTALHGPEATFTAAVKVVANLRRELSTLPDEGLATAPALFGHTPVTESTKTKAN